MGLILTGCAASAADMSVAPPPAVEMSQADREHALRSYMERRAALLLLRAAFDVVAPEDIAPTLIEDARRLAASGPSAEGERALDEDLLSEASYFIVSLRYLVATGGAAWPSDRPATSYAYDADVQLQALRSRLIGTALAGADPLPVLQAIERIHWQTEGYATPPADRFAPRDELVEQALADAKRRIAT